MNKVAAFALRRKNSILSISEKMFCPPQPLRFWITPAYAGKSRARKAAAAVRRDHPRVCGEKVVRIVPCIQRLGSPPRMRGKGVVNVLVSEPFRITPACAGKSPQRAHCSPVPWDHPCVCGEKIEMPYELLLKEGSPPRMRGKAVFPARQHRTAGITPACAGKSSLRWAAIQTHGDHPRVCGEKSAQM